MAEERKFDNDHDLLIRIDTKLGLLIQQFHEHKDATISKLAEMELSKFDKEEAKRLMIGQEDHETRLRRLERYGAIAIGGILVLQALIGIKII